MNNIELAGMVTLYNPSKENINNINNYIDSVEILYVVDNTENKNNKEVLPKNKKIKYIYNNENVGIGKALNIAADLAINSGYEWLLTMDQDSLIDNEIISKMVNYLQSNATEDIGLISPFHYVNPGEKIPPIEVEDVIETMTSGNIINLDAYKKVDGFKEWLFIDSVDHEYCMNLKKHGFRVLRLNDIVMKHNLGDVKIHKLFNKEYPCYNHSPFRRYFMVRNAYYLNDLYKDEFPDFCNHLINVQKGQVKRIILFESNKISKLKMMYKGYKDYKKGVVGKCPYIK